MAQWEEYSPCWLKEVSSNPLHSHRQLAGHRHSAYNLRLGAVSRELVASKTVSWLGDGPQLRAVSWKATEEDTKCTLASMHACTCNHIRASHEHSHTRNEE